MWTYKGQMSLTSTQLIVLRKILPPRFSNFGVSRSSFFQLDFVKKMSSSPSKQSKPVEDTTVLKVPGYGLPIDTMPKYFHSEQMKERSKKIRERYVSHSFGLSAKEVEILLQSITTRETAMLRIMNEFTDRPGWEREIHDESAVKEWRRNVLAAESNKILTEKCVDCCIAELSAKAAELEEKQYVKVLDSSGCVVKSDNYITIELKENLRKELLELESSLLNTHRSIYEGNIFEIVDPSLFSLVYGVTKILPENEIKLDNSLKRIAQGVTIQVPPKPEPGLEDEPQEKPVVYKDFEKYFSCKFQWLPCNVVFEDDNNTRVNSYVNSVHPHDHKKVYPLIGKMIDASIPVWNEILSALHSEPTVRIDDSKIEYDFPVPDEGGICAEWWEENRLKRISHNFTYPEPENHAQYKQPPDDNSQINLKKAYKEKGIQVIVKVSSIELTPENPTYEGERWYVEGFTNEHICATSLYFYDCENITESQLAFRYRDEGVVDAMGTDCDCMTSFWDIYGLLYKVGPRVSPIQNLGEVLVREGRLLSFSNLYQRRLSSFKLKDPSKSGHCKILTLLLIDPDIRVISTANVPPQQHEWWKKHAYPYTERLSSLPAELYDEVLEYTDGCPYTVSKAKEYRDELIQEKTPSS